jgi:hypothetical protein
MANNSASYVDNASMQAKLRANQQKINKTAIIPATNINDAANTARLAARDKKLIDDAKAATQITTKSSAATKGVEDPKDYIWNLPPHDWSLPVIPETMDPFDGTLRTNSNRNRTPRFHQYRRGRLWFWCGVEDINAVADDGTVTTFGAVADAKNKKTGEALANTALNNYGFQFLWNPTTISSSVMRNMEITPSHADRLKSVAGAFPGQETVSFNIVLDRVNDFACLKGAVAQRGDLTNASLSRYYNTGYPGSTKISIGQKITDLQKRGTMADLEYLFKAINGGSSSEGEWSTLLNKKTANIGFLMPTLLGLVLGPDVTESLSYVGWLTGITMQHEMFTQDMIPLRTTVSLNMECFAGSGIVSS